MCWEDVSTDVALPSRTNAETQQYYDKQKQVYEDVWDDEGRICWGYYGSGTMTFKEAGLLHVQRMAEHAGIGKDSSVLDLGCGLGINSFWLAEQYGCKVVGLDMSGEMIAHCNNLLPEHPGLPVCFVQGTVDELHEELKARKLTHIWSNGTIYQIHFEQRMKLWSQLAAVLVPGGKIVFDDATCPNGTVKHERSKVVIYDRLHLENLLTAEKYRQALKLAGFAVKFEEDISSHQAHSYKDLAGFAHSKGYQQLGDDYVESVMAVEVGDFGWHLFVGQLPEAGNQPRSIASLGTSVEENQKYYDGWAATYEEDLRDWGYNMPQRCAAMVRAALPGADPAQLRLLDVGAGTGLSGVALNEVGFTNVVGSDLSPESVAIAKTKNCYTEAVVADLSQPLDYAANTFDGLLCVGVMTYLEPASGVLREFARVVKPGGLICFTHRTDKVGKWTEEHAHLVQTGVWEEVEVTAPQPYLPKNPEYADKVLVIMHLYRVL